MSWGRIVASSALVCLAIVAITITARAVALPSTEELLTVVPGASSFEHAISPIEYYKMKDAQGRVVGAAFVTSSILPEVSGYGGEIDLLVGIDSSGKITRTKVLAHNEAPQIMDRVIGSGFLSRFMGHKAGDDLSDIETVSGATLSTQAMIDDARTAALAVAAELSGKGTAGPVGAGALRSLPWLPACGTIIMIGFCIASVLSPARRWLRKTTLVVSVLTIGVWLNTPITIGDIVDVRNLAVSWLARLPLVLLMIFAVAASLWRGNLYCAYICPFGALQVGAGEILPVKCCPDERGQHAFAWLRWLVAIATIYAIADMGSYAFRQIEPFALCFSRSPDRIALIQTGVVLVAALFVRRIWCRFFCPTGLVMDLMAMIGGKVRHSMRHLPSFVRRGRGR
ncbi:MAG: 4Fe-4S binding protein [bacterium]